LENNNFQNFLFQGKVLAWPRQGFGIIVMLSCSQNKEKGSEKPRKQNKKTYTKRRKKDMKKVIALVLAAAMVLGMCTTAFAYDGGAGMNPENPTGDTEIQFSPVEGESYIVTIPAKVVVNDPDLASDYAALKVEASDVRLRTAHQVEVSVNSANGWQMLDSTKESKIAYTVYDKTAGKERVIANGDKVLTVKGAGIGTITAGDITMDVYTTSQAVAAATVLGKHTDNLTFTCEMARIDPDPAP